MNPTHTEFAVAINKLLRLIGEDPERDGLRSTPDRVARAWLDDWTAGYDEKPEKYLTTFEVNESYDDFIVHRNITFFSHCEHHLAPFFGRMTIGYLPSANKVVGLSKIVRVVRAYSRRLQVQERLVHQIADCIEQGLQAGGVGVIAEAQHLCMMSRGVSEPSATVTTCALRGSVFKEPELRAEFLAHHNRNGK